MRAFAAVLAIAGVLLSGCSSTIPVKVDSITSGAQGTGSRYLWFSGMEEVARDDLYFREFSRYFRTVLERRGYHEGRADGADLAIYFSYGITPGRTVYYTTSTPVYGWFGGDTFVYVESGEGGESQDSTRTIRTVTTPIYRRVVGMDVDTRSYTLFTSFATLEAKRFQPGKSAQQMETVWKITASTTGRSNDLRALMPALALAAAPYIGKDSGAAKIVKVKRDDPALQELRRRSRLQD